MAMKATHGVFGGKAIPIYKDPKTDEGGLKKSQKGCCRVTQYPVTGEFRCEDGYEQWVDEDKTALKTVFKDGNIVNEKTFHEIRATLYPEV
jgi:nicotinic acid phosphoribosyltransferase